MTAPLPFTGERFTPEQKGEIWYERGHRYCAVLAAARGKRALDAAFGEGYGSWLLGAATESVVGIDRDNEAIDHARTRSGDRATVRYPQGTCTALPLADASVDLVVSFETNEHLDIGRARRRLREDEQ